MNVSTVLMIMTIGLTAGVLSGLVGVGGGIIIVPALVFFLGFSQQAAQGTSLGLLLLPVGVLAVFNYYNQGFINWKVIAIMCGTFIVGGWLGSKIALSIPEQIVRKIFAALLFYTAFKMLKWDVLFLDFFKNIFINK